ncbi:MAG TPA: ATP-binding protein [Pirellulales bacterium]|nr:ATP-binding protein [Pirellulales bacterium]
MFRSFRWRIQLWHTLILVVVVSTFAGVLYWNARIGRQREFDNELLSAAQVLSAAVSNLPPHELAGGETRSFRGQPPRDAGRGARQETTDARRRLTERGRLPPEPGRGDAERRPPPKPSERILAELALPETLKRRPGPPGSHAWFAVWRGDGQPLKQSSVPPNAAVHAAAGLGEGEYVFRRNGERRWVSLAGPHGSVIDVGRSIEPEQRQLDQLFWQLVAVGAGVMLIGLVGGFVLSRNVVQPLVEMSATAAAISATNLSRRIDTANFDRELQSLAATLNGMFQRLEAAFERQSRFTADASHELRTPLTVIITHLEYAARREGMPAEDRETLDACLRAARRMKSLIEGLLLLARVDAGSFPISRQPCDLAAIVEECVELLRPLADTAGVALKLDLPSCEVEGDPAWLAQIVINLLSNALRYNRPGGEVAVTVAGADGDATLTMSDTGVGIPPVDQPHLFQRFYRVDKARSRDEGGNGLGLAITKSLVELHGGEITFTSETGQGTTFVVRLPTSAVSERAI